MTHEFPSATRLTMSVVQIIGVGSPHGDDWLGWELAERLRASDTLSPRMGDIVISLHDRPGAALLQAWKGTGSVVLMDSVRSGAQPGTIHRLDSSQLVAQPRSLPSQGFGVAEAVQMAAALDALPDTLQFFGVEADPENAELRLSEAVHAVLPELVREIEEFVLARLAASAGTAP